MTALVPCPLCGYSEGYYLREGSTYRWWEVSCRACSDQVSECRADRDVSLTIECTHPRADAAWNEAGAYAEALRVACQLLIDCEDSDPGMRGLVYSAAVTKARDALPKPPQSQVVTQ
jgi:hypothetical protein